MTLYTLNPISALERRSNGSTEAHNKQMSLCRGVIQQCAVDSRGKWINILDFGTGNPSISRGMLEMHVGNDTGYNLTLYDPHVPLRGSRYRNVRTTFEDPFSVGELPYDAVNISYVLNSLDERQIQEVLERIRNHSPQAVVMIFDYVLKGRGEVEALRLLTSDREMSHRAIEGDDKFFGRRSRFSLKSIIEKVQEAGMNILNAQHLSQKQIRAAVIAKPHKQFPEIY